MNSMNLPGKYQEPLVLGWPLFLLKTKNGKR